jgi:deoxyadenosine/deoxycytidine kinase
MSKCHCNIKIVSIEGNIGSGKSTLLENLRKYYGNNSHIIFLKEPVDDWEKIQDKQGNTILKKFYADQEKYSFPFQMMAYISRLKILRDTFLQIETEKNTLIQNAFENMLDYHKNKNTDTDIKKPDKFELPTYILITERSLYTDKHVFAKMLFEQGKIEDVCYQIYLNWFEEFAKDYPINYSVYVKTNPENCYKRVHKRARHGEELIPLSYLQECHNYHEVFLDETRGIKTNKIILDGNIDIYENKQVIEQWLDTINNAIL